MLRKILHLYCEVNVCKKYTGRLAKEAALILAVIAEAGAAFNK
ncbi:hypothetical protein J11TS1_27770 [Oceanobacillus sp. J11TS1]|nr:hypothetical protein J11TS1_27770 [Oceanobacillus sp. J11TS1]